MGSATYGKKSLSLVKAKEIIDAAEKQATKMGIKVVIAVCDESGILKAFSRMDEAPFPSVQVAQDKAYTAAGFGTPTEEWYEKIKEDKALLIGAPTGIKRFIIFDGGYPIKVDGQIVGGIGVSGSSSTQDAEVARAGLAALANLIQNRVEP